MQACFRTTFPEISQALVYRADDLPGLARLEELGRALYQR